MQSTFSGIEIGKRSIVAHSTALNTVGHNLSNASVDGYSRQVVQFKAFEPIYFPGLNRELTPGQIGQGMEVSMIKRVEDLALEGRIVSRNNGLGYWDSREKYLGMVAEVYNEPMDISVRANMDRFWESWQKLSLNPADPAVRVELLERGQALTESFQHRYESLNEIRQLADTEIGVTVAKINELLRETAAVNDEIVRVKATGNFPNDLLDRRDKLVREISDLVDIEVITTDIDDFSIVSGGLHLLQGKQVTGLNIETDPINDGLRRVVWGNSGEDAIFRGGRLKALLDVRDTDVRGEIQKLDSVSLNFMDLVNENHQKAFDLNGNTGRNFFQEYRFVNNVQGRFDSNNDGAFDSTYLYRVTGANKLDPKEQIGLDGTLTFSGRDGAININYFSTDTVEQVIQRINVSGSEVVARLNSDGKLVLRASESGLRENPDFVIRQMEDSGDFLTSYSGILNGSGPEGGYNWQVDNAGAQLNAQALTGVAPVAHPSGWMEVNQEILADPTRIAAGFGVNGRPELGDGSAALAIASIRDQTVMVGRLPSFDSYFSEMVASIGSRHDHSIRAFETEAQVMKDLQSRKESLVGVNIDEELTSMMKFQHGYSAASRFVTEIDKMLDVIINRMGV